MRDANPWAWQDAEIDAYNRRHRRVARVVADPMNDARPPLEQLPLTDDQAARSALAKNRPETLRKRRRE